MNSHISMTATNRLILISKQTYQKIFDKQQKKNIKHKSINIHIDRFSCVF